MIPCFLFCVVILSTTAAIHPLPSWFTAYKRSISTSRRYCNPTTTSSQTDFIENLVQQRHQARKTRDFVEADRIKVMLEQDHNVVLVDHPYSKGGHTTWSFQQHRQQVPECSLMQLARDYRLLVASGASEVELIEKAIRLLVADESISSGQREMQGRKHADAAFSFALAGVKNTTLFDLLNTGATNELLRYGHRTSCRTIDILQMVEKLAAAGIQDQKCYVVAADLLRQKSTEQENQQLESSIALLSSGNYSLFADRPLLWLWRYASNTHKHGLQFDIKANSTSSVSISSSTKEDLDHVVQLPIFHDNTLPLTVDIGCGYGVSLLGMGYHQQTQTQQSSSDGSNQSNYLGCDMSPTSIGYAQSIAMRWEIENTTQFVVMDAESLLQMLVEYPGPIRGIHINFPTPYKFEALLSEIDDRTSVFGNAQLPNDMSTFMFTPNVVEFCRLLLHRHRIQSTRMHDDSNDEMMIGVEATGIESSVDHKPGYLLLQSNVEDVCVTMKHIVLTHTTQQSKKEGHDKTMRSRNDFVLPDDRMIHQLFGYLTDDKTIEYNSTVVSMSTTDTDTDTTTSTHSQSYQSSSSQSLSLVSDIDSEYDHDSNNSNVHDDDIDGDLTKEDGKDNILQKRTFRWIASGGERAEGPQRGKGWIPHRLLPPYARTETEAMCDIFGKPVHRIVFTIRS